jgi:hypothetical protein
MTTVVVIINKEVSSIDHHQEVDRTIVITTALINLITTTRAATKTIIMHVECIRTIATTEVAPIQETVDAAHLREGTLNVQYREITTTTTTTTTIDMGLTSDRVLQKMSVLEPNRHRE